MRTRSATEPAGATRNARCSGDRGVALAEFSLLFPLLAMVTMGAITASMALADHLTLTHAAREGARYGATFAADQELPPGETWATAVRRTVLERAMGDVTAEQVCVARVAGEHATPISPAHTTRADGHACFPDGGGDAGERVQVHLEKPAQIDGLLFTIDLQLSSSATARGEIGSGEG